MDAVKILAVFLITLGVPFAVAGLWWWVIFWVCVGSLLGAYELIAKLTTGNTISKMFWIWKAKAPKWQVRSVIIGMILFWGYLIMHLLKGW